MVFFNSVPDRIRGFYVCLEHLILKCFAKDNQCNGEFAKKLLLKDEAVNCIGCDSSYIANCKQFHNAFSGYDILKCLQGIARGR